MEHFFNFEKLAYLRGAHPKGCIPCLIAAGSEEVEKLVVAERGGFVACLNLYPYNPGHLIVFPRRHVTDLRELLPAETGECDALVRRLLNCLDSLLRPAGYNIGYNMGRAAGASIEHLHLHIIPRYDGEIGIAELLGGKRVLVQDPRDTLEALRASYLALPS